MPRTRRMFNAGTLERSKSTQGGRPPMGKSSRLRVLQSLPRNIAPPQKNPERLILGLHASGIVHGRGLPEPFDGERQIPREGRNPNLHFAGGDYLIQDLSNRRIVGRKMELWLASGRRVH